MKNAIAFLLLFTAYIGTSQNFIDKNFKTYEDHEEATVVHVTAKSFELASYVLPSTDEEAEELKEFVASVTALDVVAVPDLDNAEAEYNRGIKLLQNGFSELLNIKEKSNRFSVFIDEENDVVYELVGIGFDESELVVVSLTGEMRLELIASVISKIDNETLNPLSKISEVKATEFGVYPNPVNAASSITIEIPATMKGGMGTVYDLTGAAIEKFDITDSIHKVKTDGFSPGTYVIGLEKDGVSIKKQVVVVR